MCRARAREQRARRTVSLGAISLAWLEAPVGWLARPFAIHYYWRPRRRADREIVHRPPTHASSTLTCLPARPGLAAHAHPPRTPCRQLGSQDAAMRPSDRYFITLLKCQSTAIHGDVSPVENNTSTYDNSRGSSCSSSRILSTAPSAFRGCSANRRKPVRDRFRTALFRNSPDRTGRIAQPTPSASNARA